MKTRPLSDALLLKLAREHGTPLYVYDGATVVARARELLDLRASSGRGFDVVRYAQKANPSLALLRLLRSQGCQVDAVSGGELRRALAVGFDARDVLFCADLLDRDALDLLARQPFQLNAGSPFMLAQYARANPPRRDIVLRVNPGFGHGHDRKVTTGGEHSKHGIWHADLPAVAREARTLGLEVAGLHVHIGSGSDLEHLSRATEALVTAAALFGPTLRSLSAGGGLPIPYRAGEQRFDCRPLVEAWDGARARVERELGRSLRLELEPGRFLVAEAGLLLAEARGWKRVGSVDYLFVDAGFHNLVRPAMYGAHHEISVIGRDGDPCVPQAVAGPLCESADVFTQAKDGTLEPRFLPRAVPGDIVCFHDAGAYASAMASGYNSQLLAAEVLVHNRTARLVRARQTHEALLRPELDLLE
ncbi:MAG: diaminopimelate decarboxylase [Planctomycetes bacterium]|nr:diaminopimelate decarboxylase [Planctomycetota bacterium]